ncbi:hypothetical protein AB0K12_23815 [Nonomuraea sp. NPDC049419]|uniref:hypothetical protein n=1 Tax=Nonomuraea sp. NPDC049419 TaxID=3155772 RepID=UPI003414F64E
MREMASISAWLELSPTDRHLAVLRLTYPQWHIEYIPTPRGLLWRAVPSWQVAVGQAAAGVRPRLERSNPVALMADLSRQMSVLLAMPRR